MIDKNIVCNAIITKLIDEEIVSNIAYENEGYTPPEGCTLYVLASIIPTTESLLCNTVEGSFFSLDLDIYVPAGNGSYVLRNTMKTIGDLFNPKDIENAHWVISGQTLNINNVEEVQGAKTDDGWYYSTLRLNLKVTK